MDVSRRNFLGSSAAAIIVAGTVARGKVFGANDRIRVACVGIRGRGWAHAQEFQKIDGCDVVALCDVDSRPLADRVGQLESMTGRKPKSYKDMRDIMADDGVDAVSFATPNHWHTLGAIWACQAGKHVYVEKPISHGVWEGRQLVAAAEQSGCIVQHGTQRRSDPRWMRATRLLREGIIGPVYMARLPCFNPRESIGFKPPEPPPGWLDWHLWQGPATEREFCANYVHYNWHWFWHYGNGEIGNNGVHIIDVALWALSQGLPVKIHSAGGRFGYDDQAETPNTQVSTFTCADGTVIVQEVRGRFTNDEAGIRVGLLFYGADGYAVDHRFYDKDGKEIPVTEELPPSGGPFRNFLDAVRSGKKDYIHGTALDGHLASSYCHLANISYRLGRSLDFDPATETFPGDKQANKLLKREYREPFVVPQLA
jgi:predicted dehydrogenase